MPDKRFPDSRKGLHGRSCTYPSPQDFPRRKDRSDRRRSTGKWRRSSAGSLHRNDSRCRYPCRTLRNICSARFRRRRRSSSIRCSIRFHSFRKNIRRSCGNEWFQSIRCWCNQTNIGRSCRSNSCPSGSDRSCRSSDRRHNPQTP